MKASALQPSEAQEQATLFALLKTQEARYPQLRWIHASMNGASASSMVAAVNRQRQGQKKGVPDICIPLRSKGHGCAWIELKRKGGRVTTEQQEFLKFAESQGHAVTVAYSADEAFAFIKEYLGI